MTAITLNSTKRSAAGRAGLTLTLRGRRVLAALLLAPVALGVGIGVAQIPAAFADDEASASGGVYEQFETHTVLAGESLWDIAAGIAGNQDVRDVVVEIQRLNGLSGSSLQAGQQLALPNL
ncbi:LysM peptidoglycan-binding domain-containing protein [Gulosibacter molinativorax]|uniref:LysM peptidoglycan-binding domain-containing protein n=1 Tax=Gulosibacter molinativorax TaxID=256821 RepID=A0ABT7C907_9MICO|nr:LysM peptidoglycan-binding domain-containing protein [Gulosibacter molinativorax]MDJ1371593.1 LysM peptidoglycan-binding domain-containing protein [Gulosibacter molinativorax]QUY61064.1 Hypotetical protein [Gulosibacter molinativorax]